MVGFCDADDVRQALQKADLEGSLAETDFVEPAIEAASRWFANATNTHWYDSNSTTSDLIDSSAASVTEVRLDLPSSPHRQHGFLITQHRDIKYPVRHDGPYSRVLLPHPWVSTLNKLEVRELDGEVTDWVADSDFTSGVGNDYYLQQEGQDSYGRSFLYVEAKQIAPRRTYRNLLTLDYDYGRDWQTQEWHDVRRGVANLAAAEVLDSDNVLAQVPDQGQLIGVSTQHQNLMNRASKYLDPYLTALG